RLQAQRFHRSLRVLHHRPVLGQLERRIGGPVLELHLRHRPAGVLDRFAGLRERLAIPLRDGRRERQRSVAGRAAIAESLAVPCARPVNGNGLVRRSLLSYGVIVTCRAPPASFFLKVCSKRSFSVMTAPFPSACSPCPSWRSLQPRRVRVLSCDRPAVSVWDAGK